MTRDELREALASMQCSDHHCVMLLGQRRIGMGTNGGCKCMFDRVKASRFGRLVGQHFSTLTGGET